MDGEWRVMTIGDLAAVRSDRVMPSPRSDEPYVGLEHIESESGRLIGVGRAGDTVSLKTPFQAGDILYGKLRPALRKVLRAPICGLASTEILAVVPKLASDGPFVKHILHSDQVLSWALQGAEGTKMPRTSWQRLSGFQFLCPTPAERAAIAATLDAIDEAIEKTEAVIAATEDLRKALLQELLTRGVPGWHTEWKTVPGIGTIPACWKTAELGNHLAEGPSNGLYKPESAYGSGTWIIRIGDFQPGRLTRHEFERVRVSESERDGFGVTFGDILINRVNSLSHLGKSVLIPPLTEIAVFESNMMRLRPEPALSAEFLLAVLCSPLATRHFTARAKKAVAQCSINQTDVRQLPVPLPEPEEQATIARCALVFDAALEEHDGVVSALRAAKTKVADALLSGQLRVPAEEVSGG